MIHTQSRHEPWQALVSNGRHEVPGDAPIEKGGGGQGMGAHDLLEASLALCMSMAVRMHAAEHSIPLDGVRTHVHLVRPDTGGVVFEYALELEGPLNQAQRNALEEVAADCPVRRTLSQPLAFVRSVEPAESQP